MKASNLIVFQITSYKLLQYLWIYISIELQRQAEVSLQITCILPNAIFCSSFGFLSLFKIRRMFLGVLSQAISCPATIDFIDLKKNLKLSTTSFYDNERLYTLKSLINLDIFPQMSHG